MYKTVTDYIDISTGRYQTKIPRNTIYFTCDRCGKTERVHQVLKRQFCETCRKEIAKEKTRDRVRKFREKQRAENGSKNGEK